MKAVIWGHKLHTHTHSYVHEGFWRAFKYLGYDTYWLDDQDDVSGIDFSRALMITEGQVDRRIPIRDDCHYVLHNCDRRRYASVASRCLALQVYTHGVSTSEVEALAPFTFYGAGCLTQPWATDLLPHEIDLSWAERRRKRRVMWVGTIGAGLFGNVQEIEPFRRACGEHGVRFIHRTGVDRRAHVAYVQASWLAPAIHGAWQVANGYIACRIFKNISYGQMGLTNSATVHALFDEQLIHRADTFDLFAEGEALMQRRSEYVARIRDLMRVVRERHTYINRIETILSVLPGGG